MGTEPNPAPADASREARETLVAAIRRAAQDERPDVGTDHLLAALVDGESAAKDVAAPGIRDAASLTGMIKAKGAEHWVGRDEADDGAPAAGPGVTALVREAAWAAVKTAPPRPTGALTAALARAFQSARDHGVALANPSHLLMGLLHDPGNRACEALLERRMDREEILAALADHPSVRQDGTRSTLPLDGLRNMGMLTERGRYWGRLARSLSGGGFGSPVVPTVRQEAVRQAVRLGHPEVTPAHLLLGMLVMDDELTRAGLELRAEWAGASKGAELLRERGVTLGAVAGAPGLAPVEADVEADTDAENPSEPRLHEDTERVLARTRLICNERKDPSAGTTHLLTALVEEPGGACDALLASLGVETGELREALAR